MTAPLRNAIRSELLHVAEERDLAITVADVTALAEAVLGAALDATYPASPVQLTNQQTSVLVGLAHGESPEDTARRLCVSSSTVRTHRRAAYKRLGARTAGQAIALAMTYGLLRPALRTYPLSLPGQRNGSAA